MDLLDQNRKYDFDRVVRILVAVGTLVGGYLLLSYLSDILIPFGVAFVLAYLLNPIATFFQKKTKNRILAVSVTFVLFLGAVGLVIGLLVPRVIAELSGISQFVAEYAHKGPEYWQHARDRLPPEVITVLHDLIRSDKVQDLAATAAQKVAPGLWGVVTGALSIVLALMTVIIVLMYLVFLLIDFQRVESTWKDYLPPQHRDAIVEFLEDFNGALSKYFRGQTIVALAVGILFAIGFSIVGIRLAIVLGLLIGLLNMVPYLQNVAIVPAFLLALLRYLERGEGFWWYIIGVALVFIIVQLIQDAILVPKIMGDVTGLRPAVIMLSIFVWGKLLGFMGLLLAIPLTVLAVTYYERMIARQRQLAQGPPSLRTGAEPAASQAP
jgi:predicted PurR-regulated permease PerM